MLSTCVVSIYSQCLSENSNASQAHLFCKSPNDCHFNRLANAAAKSLCINCTSWLNLDVNVMILKFFIFIMGILFYFFSLSFSCFQHPRAFPSQTLHVSLCSSSCPGIRGMCGCASQIVFQQLLVGVSGDYHVVQVTHDYPVNGGQHLTIIPT